MYTPSKINLQISLLLACILTLTNVAKTQEPIQVPCPSDDVFQKMLNENPAFRKKQELYEKTYQYWTDDTDRTINAVSTLPTVIHIFHAGQPLGSPQNHSDAEVQEIIAEATQRFRHSQAGAGMYSNPYYGVDTEVELCIANVDPAGNSTTGINRYNIPALSQGTYTDLAPLLNPYKWDVTKYMNIFIVAELQGAGGVYLGGSYDFTIYNSGSFWSGLVAHEQGHYLSLNHTFFTGNCGNNNCLVDGDKVCDTPPKALSGMQGGTCPAPNNTCTTDDDDLSSNNPYRPVSMGGLGDQPDMLANYMDYTFNCWDAFTIGQKARMTFNIINFRSSVVAHAGIACAGTQNIYGCTDPLAHNYNPEANIDDGSCETCADGIENGDEQGVDCGGNLCSPCPVECVIEGYTLTLWDDWCPFSGATVNVQGPAGHYYDLKNLTYNITIPYQYNTDVQVGISDIDVPYLQYEVIDQNNPNCLLYFTVENVCDNETGSGCTDALGHNYDENATIDDGSCETCIDGIRNGDETDVDCGGILCGPCLPNCGSNIVIDVIQCYANEVTFDFHLTNPYFEAVLATWLDDPNNIQVRNQLYLVTLNETLPEPNTWGRVTFPLNHQGYNIEILYANNPPNFSYCFDTIYIDNPCDNPVVGCTDPSAHNYNPNAQQNDGSCQTCFDGKRNGDETGIDCGGSKCSPCPNVDVVFNLPKIVYMCPGDSVLINAKVKNGKPPFIYEWTSSNGQFITDFESVWISTPGSYTVCVSSQNHSTTCLNFEVVESKIGCTGAIVGNYNLEVNFPHGRPGLSPYQLGGQTTNTSISNEIRVFPNPAPREGSVVALLPKPVSEPGIYQILDLSGRLLGQESIIRGTTNLTIPLRGINSGTYILKVEAGETYVSKVVIF